MNELAYEQGKEAKLRGWERWCPHARNEVSLFWLAGYDGIPYHQVQALAARSDK